MRCIKTAAVAALLACSLSCGTGGSRDYFEVQHELDQLIALQDESDASEMLAKARSHYQAGADGAARGEYDAAAFICRSIIRNYPESPQAGEARAMLRSIPGEFAWDELGLGEAPGSDDIPGIPDPGEMERELFRLPRRDYPDSWERSMDRVWRRAYPLEPEETPGFKPRAPIDHSRC